MLATVLSAKGMLIAHAGESHEETATTSENILAVMTHQSFIVSLIICAVILMALYGLLGIFKVNPLSRLLYLIPASLALGVVYYQHQPAITTLVLSLGFILTFLLAFTMLRGK